MTITQDQKVGEVVAKDFRLAGIFSKYGIDFCCGGGKSIAEVCRNKNIDSLELLQNINHLLTEATQETVNYDSWPIDLLADYIEKKHHRYVREQIPVLQQFLEKVAKVHGEAHPELIDIKNLFNAAASELTKHMMKEELILFPYIRQMVSGNNDFKSSAFTTVEDPIKVMIEEHDTEGERFRQIAELSDNYTPPDYACNTYKASFVLLNEFEKDLHLHIHLENNILFPKTIKLQQNVTE